MKPAFSSFILFALLASLFFPIIAPEAQAAQSVADLIPNPVGIGKSIAGGVCIAAAKAVRDALIGVAESVYVSALDVVNKVYELALSAVLTIKIAVVRIPLKIALNIAYNVVRSLVKSVLAQAEGIAQEKFRAATNRCPKGNSGVGNCLSLAGLEVGPDGVIVKIDGVVAQCPDIEKLAWDPLTKQCVCSTDVLPTQGSCDLSWDRDGNALTWTSQIVISDAEKHENPPNGTIYKAELKCDAPILEIGGPARSIDPFIPTGSEKLIPPAQRPNSSSCTLTVTPKNSSIAQEFSCSASVENQVQPPT